MRKTYKFSHSVAQGGFFYTHKTLENLPIKNKEGLRNLLVAVERKLELLDVTIKIYENIFFFFFQHKPKLHPQEIIKTIQKHISQLQDWDEKYLYSTVYDLQEEYLRKDLKEWGYDYDEG